MRTTTAGAILAVAALTGCAVAPDDTDEDAGDAGGVTDPVSDVPNMRACGGGRFTCFAIVQTQNNAIKADASTPSGLTPTDLQSAYNIKVSLNTHATIAIVDAFDYPAAESDLATYRSQFGLPPCTTANGCFKRVNQNGAASPLPGKQPPGDDWNLEAALDLDMASAACPSCKIVLVEAQDDQGTGLYIGNDGGAAVGAAVVSNSWGGSEDGTEEIGRAHV